MSEGERRPPHAGEARHIAPSIPVATATLGATTAARDGGLAPARSARGHLRLRLVLLDAFTLTVAWLAMAIASSSGTESAVSIPAVLAAVVGGLVMIAGLGLYRSKVSSVRARELSRLIWLGLAVPLPPALVIGLAGQPIPWLALAVGGVVSFLLLVVTRSGFDAWLRDRRTKGEFCRNVAIVGTNSEALALYHLFADHPELGYRVAGFVGPPPEKLRLPDTVPYLGAVDDIERTLRMHDTGGVVVAAGVLDGPELRRLLRTLLQGRFHVHLSGGLWGIGHRRVVALPIGHEPLFYIEPPSLAGYQLAVKRALDIVASSLLLLLALPVMFVCAVIIKLQDGGPIFFRQQRVGRNGQPFDFYKLRSMVPNADQQRAEIEVLNLRDGPLFKADNDPRITPFGRILRMSSLDEMPQLLNVVKGDMSLVGPRPALGSEYEQFDEELIARQAVRPGISGLWQVEARDNPSFSAYRRLDLFYVENWSVSLDLVILVLTAEQVTARIVRALFGLVRPQDAATWA
jgi:exopolysaccharide biosynthesis polyprenyl glycosylphosphotransferase